MSRTIYIGLLIVVTGLAALMNGQFGYSIGQATDHALEFGVLFGTLSALLLITGFIRKQAREHGETVKERIAIGLTAFLALAEIVGVMSTVGGMRFAATAQVDNQIALVTNLESEIEESKKIVDSFTQVPRPVAGIQGDIDAKYAQVVEKKTVKARLGDCSDRNKGPKTYDLYCGDIKTLEAELASAAGYWTAKAKLTELREKRSTQVKPATGNSAAKALADMVPFLSQQQWESVIVLFVSALIVMVGIFGPEVIPAPKAKEETVKPLPLPQVELSSVPQVPVAVPVPQLPAPVAMVEEAAPVVKKKRKKRKAKAVVVEPAPLPEPVKPQVIYRYRTKVVEKPVEVEKIRWKVRNKPKKKSTAKRPKWQSLTSEV